MSDSLPDPLDFEPVPSASNRRDGWTPERQRRFLAALARCGSVAAAARHVGKSASGAYRLRDRDGAESFATAWDMAAEEGRDRIRDCVIDRATNGAWVPVTRRGRIVRMEFRYFDRLAIAILSGRDRALADTAEDRAETRALRRRRREEERRRSKADQEAARRREEVRAQDAAKQPARCPRARPRITLL